MKHRIIARRIFLLIFTVTCLSAGCSFGSKEDASAEVPSGGPKVIEPRADAESPGQRTSTMEIESLREIDQEQPKLTPDPSYAVLQVENENLDFDQSEEQVLVMKLRDNPESQIRVGVIDFDTVRNQYTLAWEADTNATVIRTFNLHLADIVGDHTLELVCSGINTAGERTLDIYRKTLAPNGVGLYYENICSIVADGSIEIQEHERTPAYKLGQKNGISFPIIALSHDKESENIMDLVKQEYYWKYQANRYVLGRVEKLPGDAIEEQQLQELFTKGAEAFAAFLNDPWIRLSTEDEESESFQDIIFFDLDQKQISFYSEEVQEIYDWETTHRSRIPNSVFISGKNQLVPFIVKDIAVYITSLDSVTIDVGDSDFQSENYQWDGRYYRVKDSSMLGSGGEEDDTPSFVPEDLTGEFVSEKGDSVVFDYPSFTMLQGEKTIQGGYTVFRINGDTILEFKILANNRTLENTLTYSAEYSVEVSGSTRIHTLRLQPGNISVRGFVSADSSRSVFQRIEIIEKEDELKEP